MLLDVLGIAVGFATVMLLLSLIVTVLVQMIQSALGLRSRNLLRGLRSLLDREGLTATNGSSALAEDAVEAARITPARDTGVLGRLASLASDPPGTWVRFEDLVDLLEKRGVSLGEGGLAGFRRAFERMEAYLSARFVRQARIVAAVCGLGVAFLFQVSATDLFRDLATDPQLRTRYAAAAEQALTRTSDVLASASRYQDAAPRALELLQEHNPDLAPQIEQVAGVGTDRDDVVQELSVILSAEVPARRDAVVEEYRGLLDNVLLEDSADALGQARKVRAELALLDITPWQDGLAYYGTLDHWVGVLITAMLLSLGAPFWFDTLSRFVKLRDALEPTKVESAGQGGQTPDGPDAAG